MRLMRLTRRAVLLTGATSLAVVATPTRRKRALFVLGDSWAAGLHADPDAALGQVASARLGWRPLVDAVSGTGYVEGAATGTAYPDRALGLQPDPLATIAVVQGGSNDRAASATVIVDAVHDTLATLRDRLPHARQLLLGPGPDPFPVTADQTAVDRALRRAAAREGVPYVSMLGEGWITARNVDAVIDPGNHHPTVAGQQYLGLRLAAALRARYPRLTA